MSGVICVNPNSRKREQWEMAMESGHALLEKLLQMTLYSPLMQSRLSDSNRAMERRIKKGSS